MRFSLLAADDVEAERLFAALGANGRINVPLMSTPFASALRHAERPLRHKPCG